MADEEEVVQQTEDDELREVFNKYSEDEERLSVSKLREALQERGVSPTQDYLLFEQSEDMKDVDSDGVSFEEFARIYKAAKGNQCSFDEYVEALKTFDTSGDGYIEKEELIAIVAGKHGGTDAISEEEAQEILDDMLAKADTDNDGNLSIDELARHILGISTENENADGE
ncbi:calmodulin-like 3 [Mactra antiquata]